MGVAHVGLVHCDPCECKVKGFRAVSSIERNVSNRRHLQGMRQTSNIASLLRRSSRKEGVANPGGRSSKCGMPTLCGRWMTQS